MGLDHPRRYVSKRRITWKIATRSTIRRQVAKRGFEGFDAGNERRNHIVGLFLEWRLVPAMKSRLKALELSGRLRWVVILEQLGSNGVEEWIWGWR